MKGLRSSFTLRLPYNRRLPIIVLRISTIKVDCTFSVVNQIWYKCLERQCLLQMEVAASECHQSRPSGKPDQQLDIENKDISHPKQVVRTVEGGV